MLVSPRRRASAGGMITSSGSTPSRSLQQLAHDRARRLDCLPPVEDSPRATGRVTVRASRSSKPSSRKCSITSGTPPARKNSHGRMIRRAVRQDIDESRHLAIDVVQSSTVGRRSPPRTQSPECAAAGSSNHRTPRARPSHCESPASVRMSRIFDAAFDQRPRSARALRVAMSSQIGWPLGASAECGSDKPSASATTCDVAAVPRNWQPPPGDRTRRAAGGRGFFERDFAVHVASADRLHLSGVFARGWRQRHAAGHEHGRQVVHRRQRHHHRRQALVARRHAEHSGPRRQRTNQPSQDDRGVVAIRQAVEHAGRSLRAAVARDR